MRRSFLFVVITMMLPALSFAQNDGQGNLLKATSSSRGNYIYLFSPEQLAGNDSSLLVNTAYFIVQRRSYDTGRQQMENPVYQKIGEARRVTSLKELQSYFTSAQIAEIKTAYGLKSDKAVAEYFNTHSNVSAYPLIYSSIETKLALGHVFLDKDVKPGEVYMYAITRVLKNKKEEPWGMALKQSKSGNYLLPWFKPVVSAVKASDSMVSISWKMAISEELIQKVPVPRSNVASDVTGGLVRMPFGLQNTKARVFVKGADKFIESAKLYPLLNNNRDTITYTYAKKCMPEEEIIVYLQTEDEVYNEGISSDTAIAYAISNKIVPLVYGIRVKDVLNGVRLSWDKLPAKPYIVAVEIRRTNSDDVEDSLATVPVTDTSFTDYKIAVGQHYRYKVKAIFLPSLGVEQKVPAEGIGTYTVFSRPLPPFNLKAEHAQTNVQLKWEAVDDPSFYGYYIYRGTSSRNLTLLAGPVFTRNFLDTSGSLGGRNTYHYAVVTQNLRQDTSVYSPVVSIVPERKIITSVPNSVDFYYANHVLRISWNDLQKGDNAIEGFIVQKKIKGQKDFFTITQKPVDINFVEDSLIIAGVEYQYRVASVSTRGDTSEYGNAGSYTLPKKDVMIMKIFYVRNVTEGVDVSWPQIETNRKAYNIYRREASDTTFRKISSVNAKTFSYTDKDVKAGTIYVYCLSITEEDNREGDRGKAISIRRIKS